MQNLRQQQLYDALASRILIIGGAMGTILQAYNPTIDDFLGFENCSEILNRSHPEWIQVHGSHHQIDHLAR